MTTAYTRLKEMILNNELPGGYQALEQEIAQRFGMSRTPVREALIRLQDDGLVDVIPRRGMRVRRISIDDMREIYQLLYCIEATAAELMAGRRLSPGSTEIRLMGEATDEMETSLARDDLDSWAEADARFHAYLLEFCGNRRLAKAGAAMAAQCHRVRLLTLRLRPRPTDSTADHRALLNAIRAQDENAAHQIQRAHRKRAMTLILDALTRHHLTEV